MSPAELRDAREALDLTQEQLAEQLDMTATSIGRMERGEQPIQKTTELAMRWLLETGGTRRTARARRILRTD